MSYYFAKKLPLSFEDAVRRTTEVLKQEGFGIITEIDVKQTMKAKIGVDFRNYRILGACNPKLAHEALQVEDKIGTMLPCNVVVQEIGSNQTEIAAIDPVASMQAVDNPPPHRGGETRSSAAADSYRRFVASHRSKSSRGCNTFPVLIETSTITCPKCGRQAVERMPTDACQFFYNCMGCGERTQTKAGRLLCVLLLRFGSLSTDPTKERLLFLRPHNDFCRTVPRDVG